LERGITGGEVLMKTLSFIKGGSGVEGRQQLNMNNYNFKRYGLIEKNRVEFGK
jgi:hypothetical protein